MAWIIHGTMALAVIQEDLVSPTWAESSVVQRRSDHQMIMVDEVLNFISVASVRRQHSISSIFNFDSNVMVVRWCQWLIWFSWYSKDMVLYLVVDMCLSSIPSGFGCRHLHRPFRQGFGYRKGFRYRHVVVCHIVTIVVKGFVFRSKDLKTYI